MNEFLKDVHTFTTKEDAMKYAEEHELEDAYEKYCIHAICITNGCVVLKDEYIA